MELVSDKRSGSLLFLLSVLVVSNGFLRRSLKCTSLLSSTNKPLKHIEFVKYEGLGNDFILIDNRHTGEPVLTPQQAAKLCNRNFGIGADGVIFALPGSNGCDYTLRIYNSDGSEPQMCGNGIRCLAKFLLELENTAAEISKTATSYTIWTLAGKIIPTIKPNGQVMVDMGEPILDGKKVPTLLPSNQGNRVVQVPLTVLDTTYTVTLVSMGNPHCVIFVDDLDGMKPAFEVIGPVLESHHMFPEKANIEFVQVLLNDRVKIKVWERGAGPTLACGTGACAVVVAGVLTNVLRTECTVTLPGGDLHIHWRKGVDIGMDGRVYMTGPAERVFCGVVDI
eukprot:gene30057-36301_t